MANIVDQLILHEGLELKPYKCSAQKYTIGVGHNFQDNPIPDDILRKMLALKNSPDKVDALMKTKKTSELVQAMSTGITKELAQELLLRDIEVFEKALIKKLPWYEKLDPIRKRVLLDMTFNMGIGWVGKFTNTLKLIESGEYKKAAVALSKSLWAKQVKTRATRLLKMLETGIDYDVKK
jgi:lysozyme